MEVKVRVVSTPNVRLKMPDNSIRMSLPQGQPGPPGPSGPPGGQTVDYPAGQTLFSGRAVLIDGGKAYLFDPNNVAHKGRAFGITKTSGVTNQIVPIQISGEISDAAFAFLADTMVWVSAGGTITNSQPSAIIAQCAGVASGDKKMIINFSNFVHRTL